MELEGLSLSHSHSIPESEMALLGCIMEDGELAFDLMPEWFDDLRIGNAVGSARSLLTSGRPCNSVEMARHGVLMELIVQGQQACHSTANFPSWREVVLEGYEKRRLKLACEKFLKVLPTANGSLRSHVLELDNVLMAPKWDEKKTLDSKSAAKELANHLEERFNSQGKMSGLSTGYSDLDRMTDGLQFGEMTVIAARPSIGKTAIACNLVEHICLKNKVPTLFLSLEMSNKALTRRMLSAHQKIEMNVLKTGGYSQTDFSRMAIFNRALADAPFHVRESYGGMTASEAASLIRRAVARRGVKFVVLDYLQKLKAQGKHEKRTYEVAESSGLLMEAVRSTGVAMICLAQLNRESEKDKGRMPRLSDLADSGQIERDADNVFLLHRDRNKNPYEAALIVAKQRDGETGMVPLFYEGKYCRFNQVDNKSHD